MKALAEIDTIIILLLTFSSSCILRTWTNLRFQIETSINHVSFVLLQKCNDYSVRKTVGREMHFPRGYEDFVASCWYDIGRGDRPSKSLFFTTEPGAPSNSLDI